MDRSASSHAQAALQMLVWAIEELDKAGNKEAADHVRMAMKCVQETLPRPRSLV
jgi:hypothetical protein